MSPETNNQGRKHITLELPQNYGEDLDFYSKVDILVHILDRIQSNICPVPDILDNRIRYNFKLIIN